MTNEELISRIAERIGSEINQTSDKKLKCTQIEKTKDSILAELKENPDDLYIMWFDVRSGVTVPKIKKAKYMVYETMMGLLEKWNSIALHIEAVYASEDDGSGEEPGDDVGDGEDDAESIPVVDGDEITYV